MKVSEITLNNLADYLRVDETDGLQMFLDAAISHVKGYTGLTEDELDKHDNIAIVVLAIASDYYDQRQTQVNVNNSYINKTIDAALFMHSTNFL